MKPKEIADLYKNFKEQYDKYKEAGNVENILMQVIQTADADGVARLSRLTTTTSQAISATTSRRCRDNITPKDGT